jgi:gentisate 1,2-dioxygenase
VEAVTASDFTGAENIEQVHAKLHTLGIGAGWNRREPSIWAHPKQNFLPAHWSYGVARAALEAAGKFVSTELAERRNLILGNPVAPDTYGTARTIVAAYQMVKAHEAARSHRHTPNALRLVVEGGPAVHTVVDGRKIPMLPGDVVLTPSWSWHAHQNESDAAACWIDFLDVPLTQLLEPMFFEPLPAGFIEQTTVVDEASPLRFAFAETCDRLDRAPEVMPGLRDVLLGPSSLDTLDLHVLRLEPGHTWADGRSTANSVFGVIQGDGTSVIDGQRFAWSRGDVFVVPAWRPHTYTVECRSFLLRVTDERVMKQLGWLRQEKA